MTEDWEEREIPHCANQHLQYSLNDELSAGGRAAVVGRRMEEGGLQKEKEKGDMVLVFMGLAVW